MRRAAAGLEVGLEGERFIGSADGQLADSNGSATEGNLVPE
jgi:hypothetical protein